MPRRRRDERYYVNAATHRDGWPALASCLTSWRKQMGGDGAFLRVEMYRIAGVVAPSRTHVVIYGFCLWGDLGVAVAGIYGHDSSDIEHGYEDVVSDLTAALPQEYRDVGMPRRLGQLRDDFFSRLAATVAGPEWDDTPLAKYRRHDDHTQEFAEQQ